jgi:hypothetical protein
MMTPVLRVNRLRCKHGRGPLRLDAVWTRLRRILESEERDQTQSAYQLLVAGSEEDLRAEENLLWDSGKISSAWRVEDYRFVLQLTLPTNATATVHVPSAEPSVGTEGGVPLFGTDTVELLRADRVEVVFFVGCGSYELVRQVGQG